MAKRGRSMTMRSDGRQLSWPVTGSGLNQRQVRRGRVVLDIDLKVVSPSWSASAVPVSRPWLVVSAHLVAHESVGDHGLELFSYVLRRHGEFHRAPDRPTLFSVVVGDRLNNWRGKTLWFPCDPDTVQVMQSFSIRGRSLVAVSG